MSDVFAHLPPHPAIDFIPKLLTAADLAELPSELPSGPVIYELNAGILLTMSPPGFKHGHAESRIAGALQRQGDDCGHGIACCGEVAIALSRNPDTVLVADNAFICSAQLPVRLTPEGYLETIPDLVVEVRSKNDTLAYLTRKVAAYLAAGVRVVWIVDPAARTLVEHRPTGDPVLHGDDAVVELSDLIPGFQLRLTDVFR